MGFGTKGVLAEFSRKAVLNYARTRQPRQYVGPTLFAPKTVGELSFEYWKDLNKLPVMASVQAFGAEARMASREGAEKVSGQIPTIKRKIPLNGRALIALRREGAGDNELVRDTLYNDIDNMIDACQARVEKMRMEAISTGKIVLTENNVIMTVDYGVPAGLQTVLSGTSMWSDTVNADPIGNIQTWTNAVVDSSGIRPTRALTASPVAANLVKNVNVRKAVFGDNGGSRIITLADVNALLRSLELPVIAVTDEKVRVEAENGTVSTERFFPANKFVLLPPGPLGDTLVGPTEEALLDPEVDAREVAGVYAVVYQENEPPVVWTKSAISAIPTFPMADSVFIAQVQA